MQSPDSTIVTAGATESTMDDNTSHNRNRHRHSPKSTSFLPTANPLEGDDFDGDPSFQEGGDPAVWSAFTGNFRQVQSVLDRNRALIQQVNENHQSKIHDNLVKNVALIQEINGNISKVVSLYSELSSSFSSVVHQPTPAKTNSKQ